MREKHCRNCGKKKETSPMIEWTKELPHVVGYYLVGGDEKDVFGVICVCNTPRGWMFKWADDCDEYKDLPKLGCYWVSKYPINPPEEEKDRGTPYRTPYCGNNLEGPK